MRHLRAPEGTVRSERADDDEHAHLPEDSHDEARATGTGRVAPVTATGWSTVSILRSRAGIRAVSISLAVLSLTAALQVAIYALTTSVALLADLIHNAGDALTAIPLGLAFLFRSARGERWAGLCVVLAILLSACVALVQTILRFVHPHTPRTSGGSPPPAWSASSATSSRHRFRLAAGKRLASPALTADGNHARIDGLVSLGVVASALAVGLGAPLADPLIGLAITLVILRITWESWHTVRAAPEHG